MSVSACITLRCCLPASTALASHNQAALLRSRSRQTIAFLHNCPGAHRGRAFTGWQHSNRGRALQHRRFAMESGTLSLGLEAPNFQLPEPLTGKIVSLDESKGAKAILVMFICNHCPFVVHLEQAIVDMVKHFKPQGLAAFGISANSTVTHPQDGPDKMADKAKSLGYPFHYLYDESQEVAKAYGAVCTPEFYVFDAEHKLAYHGRFDESTPRNGKPVTGDDLRDALTDILAGRAVRRPMRNSIGCGIKWHPGS